MLVTKALLQDVTVLAFVPSSRRKFCSVAKGAADSYTLAVSATIHQCVTFYKEIIWKTHFLSSDIWIINGRVLPFVRNWTNSSSSSGFIVVNPYILSGITSLYWKVNKLGRKVFLVHLPCIGVIVTIGIHGSFVSGVAGAGRSIIKCSVLLDMPPLFAWRHTASAVLLVKALKRFLEDRSESTWTVQLSFGVGR